MVTGHPPVAWILIAWEPSFAAVRPDEEYPQPGRFNEPLQFAVRTFLAPGESYLITNMAKCTIRTGPLCNQTGGTRFELCKPWLVREIELIANNQTRLVSVGTKPINFSSGFVCGERQFAGRITHYSPRAWPHFRAHARAHDAEYREFRDETLDQYRSFCRDELPDYAVDRAIETDMVRLFKWKREMGEIAERASAAKYSAGA